MKTNFDQIERNIAIRVKMLRMQEDLTQKELGQILHVSDKTISDYENSVACPSIDVLLRYCDYFGVQLAELLDADNQYESAQKLLLFEPTDSEIRMIIEYRRRPRWMQNVIRTLCLNGPDNDSARANEKPASMMVAENTDYGEKKSDKNNKS